MDEQILKDFVATAIDVNYDYDKVLSLFPELSGYDAQILKDYVATAIDVNYDYAKVNSLFPELFGETQPVEAAQSEGEKKNDTMESPSEDGGSVSSGFDPTNKAIQASQAFADVYPEGVDPQLTVGGNIGQYVIPSIFPTEGGGFEALEGQAAIDRAKELNVIKFFGGADPTYVDTESRDQVLQGDFRSLAAMDQDRYEGTLFDRGRQSEGFDSFEDSLTEVNEELIDYEEEFVVPKMNYLFGKYGFTFEETGAGDAMKVTSPNGSTEEIDLDTFLELGDKAQAGKLQSFLRQNKPDSSTLDALADDRIMVKNEQEILDTVSVFNEETEEYRDETNAFVEKYTQLTEEIDRLESLRDDDGALFVQKLYEESEVGNQYKAALKKKQEYMAEYERLMEKEKDFAQRGAKLDKAAGEYYTMASEQGTFFGAVLNKLSIGATKSAKTFARFAVSMGYNLEVSDEDEQSLVSANASNYNIDIPENIEGDANRAKWVETNHPDVYEKILDADKDQFAKQQLYGGKRFRNPFSETAAGADTEMGLVDAVDVGTREYLTTGNTTEMHEKMQSEGFWGGAILGLAESIPGMLSGSGPMGWAQRTAQMYALASEAVYDEMEEDPTFDDISESEKLKVALPVGIAVGALEAIGLRNVVAQKGLLNGVVARALGKSTSTTTAKSFKEFVEQDIQNMISRGVLTITGAGLAEFETGAAQEIAETSVKQLYNLAKDKEMFDTPDSFTEYLSDVVYAGAQEAVGGFVMGTIPAAATMAKGNKLREMPDSQWAAFKEIAKDPNYKKMYITQLKQKVASGELTNEQAKQQEKEFNELLGVMPQIEQGNFPAELTESQQKEVVQLLLEQQKLESKNESLRPVLRKRNNARIAAIDARLEEITAEAEKTKTKQDAVQESGAAEVDVQEQATPSQEVGEGDTKVSETTQEGEAQVTPEEAADIDAFFGEETETTERIDDNLSRNKEGTQADPAFEADPLLSPPTEQAPTAPEIDLEGDATVEGDPIVQGETVIESEADTAPKTQPAAKVESVVKVAKRAAKAISKTLPDVRIVLHDTTEAYQKYTNKTGRGTYQPNTKTIHINLSKATGSTVAHEVFHAALLGRVSTEGQAQAATRTMMRSVAKALPRNSELRKKIIEFSKNYDENIQNEEALAELIGLIAENYEQNKLTPPAKNAVIQFLQKLGRILGISTEFTKDDQAVIDTLNAIARKTAEGQVIEETELPTATPSVARSVKAERASERLQQRADLLSQIDDIKARRDALDKQIAEGGLIKEQENSLRDEVDKLTDEISEILDTLEQLNETEVAEDTEVFEEEIVNEVDETDIDEDYAAKNKGKVTSDTKVNEKSRRLAEEILRNKEKYKAFIEEVGASATDMANFIAVATTDYINGKTNEIVEKYQDVKKKILKIVRDFKMAVMLALAIAGSTPILAEISNTADKYIQETVIPEVESLPSYIQRGLVKYTGLDVEESTAPAVEEEVVEAEVQDNGETTVTLSDSEIHNVIPEARDGGGVQLSQHSNYFNNEDGFVYNPIPTKGNRKASKLIDGAATAHFFILDDRPSDFKDIYDADQQELQRQSEWFKNRREFKGASDSDFFPVFTKLDDGGVRVTYKRKGEITSEDAVVQKLVQYQASDIDFGKTKPAGKQYKRIRGYEDYKTLVTKDGKGIQSIIFKEDTLYSKFSGAAGLFIAETADGKRYVKDFAGSVKNMKDGLKGFAEMTGVNEGDITVAFYDAGSVTAKPAGKNGKINRADSRGFNTKKFSVSGLALPVGFDQSSKQSTSESLVDQQPYSEGDVVQVVDNPTKIGTREQKDIYSDVDFAKPLPVISLRQFVDRVNGKVFAVTSDATKVGYDSKNERVDGGFGYTALPENMKDGVGFASLDLKTLSGTIGKIAKRFKPGEKVGILIMVQNPSATIGNVYGAKYLGRGLKILQESDPAAYQEMVNDIESLIDSNAAVRNALKQKQTRGKLLDLMRDPSGLTESEFAQQWIDGTTFDVRRELMKAMIITSPSTRTNKSTPSYKMMLKDAGFNMQDFLMEYGDVELIGENNLKEDKGGFLVGGFEMEVPKRTEVKGLISEVEQKGFNHPQFNGKIPSNGNHFVFDGLYPIQSNLVEFAEPNTRVKEESKSEADARVRKLARRVGDSIYEKKHTDKSSKNYVPPRKRGYTHLKSAQKIKFKQLNAELLEEVQPNLAADVARGVGFGMRKAIPSDQQFEMAPREQKSMDDIINEGRENNFRDSVIRDYLVRRLKFPAREVDKAMQVAADIFRLLPDSFKNIEGGVEEGAKLFQSILDYQKKLENRNKRSKRMTDQEIKADVSAFAKKMKRTYDSAKDINDKVAKFRKKEESNNKRRKNKLTKKQIDARVAEYKSKLTQARDTKRTEAQQKVSEYEANLVKKNNRRAKKLTEQEIVDELIKFLQESPQYKKAADTTTTGSKKKGTQKTVAKKGMSTQQAKMVSELQKALGVRPTANMAEKVRAARVAIAQRLKGKRDVQSVQRELRNFIRRSLPVSLYSKSEVLTLLKKINEADVDTIDNMIDEVTEMVVKMNVKALNSSISNILNGKYTQIVNGIKKAAKISSEAAETIAKIKKMLAKPQRKNESSEDFADRIGAENQKHLTKYNELDAKPDKTTDDFVEMSLLEIVMEYNNSMLMEDTDAAKVSSLDSVNNALVQIVEYGRSDLAAQIAAQRAEYQRQFEAVYEDVTGEKVDMNDPNAQEQLDRSKNMRENKAKQSKVSGKVLDIARNLLVSAKTWLINSNEALDGLMDKISSLPGEMFGGKTQELVTDKVDESSRMYKARRLYVESRIREKLQEIYGKNWKSESRKNQKEKLVFYKNPQRVQEAEQAYKDNPNNETKAEAEKVRMQEAVPLSQNEMYYLYNQYKDPANRKSFEAKFGPEYERIMAEITDGLKPKVKEFADWQVNEFFPELYEYYNRVYKSIYRTNMPWNVHYAGRIYREGVESEPINLLGEGNAYNTSVGASSTKARANSNKPIQTMDGTNALMSYLGDMEYFAAYAETIRDINKLFTNEYIKSSIQNIYGKSTYTLIDNAIKKIAAKGRRGDMSDKFITGMNSTFIVSRLALSPVIFLKQLSSLFAYSNDIGTRNWIKYSAKNISELRKVWKEVSENSVYMQDRGAESITRALEAYSEDRVDNFIPSKAREGLDFLTKAMMYFVKSGDRTAIFLGGLPNYSYYKQQALSQGKSEQEAIEIAIRKFERDTKRTQQSGDLQDKDIFQTSNPLARALNMFLTTPKQYMRKEIQALRSLGRKIKQWDKNAGKGTIGQNLRTLVMYHVVLPVVFQYLAMGMPGLLRGWRDDDEDDLVRAATFGNVNGLFILGEVFTSIGDYFTGKPWAGENAKTLGIIQTVNGAIKKLKKADRYKDPEKKAKAYKDFYLELTTLTGIPAPTIGKMIDNYSKLGQGDLGESVMRLLNYGEYTISGPKSGSTKSNVKTRQEIESERERIRKREERERKKQQDGFDGGGFNGGGFEGSGFDSGGFSGGGF